MVLWAMNGLEGSKGDPIISSEDRRMDQSGLSTRMRGLIKELMKKRGVGYDDLAIALGVSHSTVKRILNSEDLSLGRIEELAKFFQMETLELISLCKEVDVTSQELSEEQELYLAQQTDVAHYFWLLLNGQSSQDIAARHGLTRQTSERYLSTLADLGFIERSGRGLVRLRYKWPIGFRFGGPLYKVFTEKIFQGFLRHLIKKVRALEGQKPSAPGFTIKVVQFILTKPAYDKLLQDSAELVAKYTSESRLQLATTPQEQLSTVSLMVGIDRFDAIADVFGELR
jgi:predicted transcriptional regulator